MYKIIIFISLIQSGNSMWSMRLCMWKMNRQEQDQLEKNDKTQVRKEIILKV